LGAELGIVLTLIVFIQHNTAIQFLMAAKNKYASPPYCKAEMHVNGIAGRFACCPLVSHVEYALHALFFLLLSFLFALRCCHLR